jgi:hypothetical protein
MSGRFTLDGSDALEQRISQLCARTWQAVREKIPHTEIDGLLLGGGYGRGEGGVLRVEAGDQPYNDLEFYLFLKGNAWVNQQRYRRILHEICDQMTKNAGLDVEITILSRRKLQHSAVTMFYYDLLAGHRWIAGDDSLLEGCHHHSCAASIPLHEATRLLMNRCSGLLFAKARLTRSEFTSVDADFVARNIAKAQLAFGDALLTALGHYHWSCRKRLQRLQEVPMANHPGWLAAVKKEHVTAVEFKLHPHWTAGPPTQNGAVVAEKVQLCAEHARVSALAREVFLWLENKRLNARFESPEQYAFSSIRKCGDKSAWRNRLISATAFGLKTAFSRDGSLYPRERLLTALPLLLWREPSGKVELLSHVQKCLLTKQVDFSTLVDVYHEIWSRFN